MTDHGASLLPRSVAGIPARALTFEFVRASGPGGQNVNKVATAVQLRVALDDAGLTPVVRARLEARVPGQITRAGELVIFAQRFRSQLRNREDALERLEALVRAARREPKARVATAPSKRVLAERASDKRHHAQRKAARRRPGNDI
ncbi:MAG: alternative ribosome rescue aminoacyl-tRNA hydrolase ArfB [Pseudomonadales bacterium]|jgi:ribosome-associated protein